MGHINHPRINKVLSSRIVKHIYKPIGSRENNDDEIEFIPIKRQVQ